MSRTSAVSAAAKRRRTRFGVALVFWVAFGALANAQARAPESAANSPDGAQSGAQGAAPIETTVGMRVRIDELPLPGTQLRSRAVDDPQSTPVIVRVLNVFPHGSGFRYNLEVMPFVAGRIDVRDHLERVDGSSTSDLPPILIESRAVLPILTIEPNPIEPLRPEPVGGYRRMWILGGILWALGLLAILFVGRGKRRADREAEAAARPRTLADRLRPLVESARLGELDAGRRAELERLLLAHWRHRLGLHDVKISQAMLSLRDHAEAGPLLRQLEQWLHRPASSTRGGANVAAEPAVDVARLLEPYRNIPADAADEPTLGVDPKPTETTRARAEVNRR